MRRRRAVAIALSCGLAWCFGQSVAPPAQYVSKGACPFECCAYGKWVANRAVPLLDGPGGKAIGSIRKGEEVLGVTGEVHTRPVRMRVERDGPYDDGVPKGSVVYLLHPVGEGFWLVWVNGKTAQIDPGEIKAAPVYQWWAKVKRGSGMVGWVRMNARDLAFDKVDRCG